MQCETGDLQNAAARAEVWERFPVLGHLLLPILQLCWEMQATVEQQMSLSQPCKKECKLPDCFPCIMLWNWIITRPYFCDKTPSRTSLSCSFFDRDLLWQTSGSCTGHRVVFFVVELSPAFGKSHLKLGWARDKHHYLKTCGCFTYTVYPSPFPQFESGGFSLFEILIYSP